MQHRESFFDRTLAPLRRALFGNNDSENSKVELSKAGVEKLKRRIDDCLDQRGGEVSARTRAVDLGRFYLELGPEGRRQFLLLLATEYGVDRNRIDSAIATMRTLNLPEENSQAERQLRSDLVPRRVELLKQFNNLSEGVKFLVDMRADIISMLPETQELRPLNDDLRELLTSWFDIGFLNLQRITWDAPAALLEKNDTNIVLKISYTPWEDLRWVCLEPKQKNIKKFEPKNI